MLRGLTLEDCLHVARLMREQDRACVMASRGYADPDLFAVSCWQTDGPAWTLLQDGEPAAVFGLAQSGWIAVAWLVAVPHMAPHSWRKLIRHARTVFGNRDKAPFHRIEANVLSGWTAAAEFAQRLGFEYEGVRRHAGANGEDIQVYAMLKDTKSCT